MDATTDLAALLDEKVNNALSALKVQRLAMHCGPGSKRCAVGPQFVFGAAPEERAMEA
jgi:hypothetical protein